MKENMEIRNVVSLFDGMSCTYMALEKAGIKFDKYYSSELDKHAIKQSSDWFPDIIRLGDVTKWREWDIDWSKVDLLVGGSPCQGFSMAGKGLAFDDERSKLYFVFEDILKHILSVNPNAKFLLENVFMKKEHEQVINNRLNITEPLKINSAILSAQNRKRNYWTNIYSAPDGLWGGFKSMIPQPKDKGILLKDILEPDDQVDEKYYIKKTKFGFKGLNVDKKARTIRTGGNASQDDKHNFDLIKVDKKGKPKKNQDKADCFTAGGNSGGNHSDMDIICVAMRGRNPDNPSDRKAGSPTKQRLEPQKDGKTNCITSVGKDNLVLKITEATKKGYTEIEPGECFDADCPKSKTRRGRRMKDKSNNLMANNNSFMKYVEAEEIITGADYRTDEGLRLRDGGKTGTLAARARNDESCGQLAFINYKIRRLTPRECARLQTVPDRYKWTVSDTQAYKMCGNGFTVDVIAYILSFIER